MLWAGGGWVSQGRGWGQGRGQPGRASDRIGVGPHGGRLTGTGRLGLRGHLAPPPPPPGILSYLNYMGMGQRDALHGTADELPPVGLLAEHPEVLGSFIRTAARVGRRLQAQRGPVRLRACPGPPPPPAPGPSLSGQLHPSSQDTDAFTLAFPPSVSLPAPTPEVPRCPLAFRACVARAVWPCPRSLVRPRPQVPSPSQAGA